MKPSELKAANGLKDGSAESKRKLKFPVDDKADPAITVEEAQAATAANCPRHGGLIGQRGEPEGTVYLCLSCKMYKRYSKTEGPSRRPLKLPKRGWCL